MESHMSKVTDLFIQVLSIPIFIHLITIFCRKKSDLEVRQIFMDKDHGISDSLIKEVRDMKR
ncbi:hypothetical protein MKX01_013924, partial [Papaver californicum]